jgi:peptide/nickel transport system substrate-binding protein
VLGPPKIELLDVRFIPNASTQLANLLAGELDLVDSPSIGATEAATARDQWVARGEGYLKTWEARLNYAEFQYREVPNWQRAVTDVRVRQALSHAIDREGLTAAVTEGLGVIADAYVIRSDPLFPEVDRAITKYPYDMSRAQGLLEEAGWRRAPDGVLRNAAGEALNMHILGHSGRVEEQETEVLASAWRSLGMPLDIAWLTPSQMRDGEYRSKFPAATFDRRSLEMAWTSEQLSTAENRWGLGNRNGYLNPRLDELWERVMTTVILQERERYLIEALQLMTADAAVVPSHLQPRVFAYPARLSGIHEVVPASNSLAISWEWRWQ